MEKNIKIGLKSTLPYFFFIVALAGTACFDKGKPSFSLTKEVHNGVVEKPTHTVVDEDHKTLAQDQSQDLDASMATEAVQPVSMHKAETTSSPIRASQKGQATTLKEATNNVSSLDQTTANSNTNNPRNTIEHNQVTEKTKEEILEKIEKKLQSQISKALKELEAKLKELDQKMQAESSNKKQELYDEIKERARKSIERITDLENAKKELQSPNIIPEDHLTAQKKKVENIINAIDNAIDEAKIDSEWIQGKINAIDNKLAPQNQKKRSKP